MGCPHRVPLSEGSDLPRLEFFIMSIFLSCLDAAYFLYYRRSNILFLLGNGFTLLCDDGFASKWKALHYSILLE